MFGLFNSRAAAPWRPRAALLTIFAFMALTATAHAGPPPVLLGTANQFAVLAGSTITNTGPTVINGDLGLHPGTAVTGFPPGTVNGERHVNDAVAQQAKSSLVTAYQDAAGRPASATLPPDIGGRRFVAGVYRTGSVPSLGLTGTVTLDAQGDPRAVFIFQIESTLTTATDSRVALLNGAQACNVYWQVGSSATLGTRTVFSGNVLALTSISVNDAVTVNGRLLARNGAVTLINDRINRANCAAGTRPADPSAGTGPGADAQVGADRRGPIVRFVRVRGGRRLPFARPGTRRPTARYACTTRNFTAGVRIRDRAGILRNSVKAYLDGRLIRRTSLTRFSLRINVRGLRVGPHRVTVVARDRAGNRSVTTRRFARCSLALAAPRFTG